MSTTRNTTKLYSEHDKGIFARPIFEANSLFGSMPAAFTIEMKLAVSQTTTGWP